MKLKRLITCLCASAICLSLASCKEDSPEYSFPDTSNLTPEEQELYDKFLAETMGTWTEEEKAEAYETADYIVALARDMALRFISMENTDYNNLQLLNKGVFLDDNNKSFYRVDLETDGNYVISILLDIDNKIYKLYNKNSKELKDLDYIDIGYFVQNLGAWASDTQHIEALNGLTPERVGSSIELYRDVDTKKPYISVQTYSGFSNIATVIAPVEIVNDKELTFSFKDDGFGHNGTGKLTYVSNENMILELSTHKSENEFGLYSGVLNLVKNRM